MPENWLQWDANYSYVWCKISATTKSSNQKTSSPNTKSTYNHRNFMTNFLSAKIFPIFACQISQNFVENSESYSFELKDLFFFHFWIGPVFWLFALLFCFLGHRNLALFPTELIFEFQNHQVWTNRFVKFTPLSLHRKQIKIFTDGADSFTIFQFRPWVINKVLLKKHSNIYNRWGAASVASPDEQPLFQPHMYVVK